MTFNGFISYSHAADGRLAPAVQRGLHRLAKPWHRRRALWIFRDQTGLSVTPALWSSIQDALDSSEWFVLLASPEAARSPWVNREIEHWIATKPADRILPVVTDGKWQWDTELADLSADSTAVPDALRGVFAEEPLYLDLRWARDDQQLSLQHAQFRDAIAQLAAPMHGVSKDELAGEDVRQHRRARRLSRVAVAALALLTVVASLSGALAGHNADRATASAVEARRQEQVALQQRAEAERSAKEAQRQEGNARTQEARARDAAAETKRQEQRARDLQGVAARAAADAKRQQQNASRQQQLAKRAQTLAEEQKAVAREQSELAQQSAKETTRQKIIAEEQQRLAAEATAETEEQTQLAQQQQRLAEEAAAEAHRQEAIARENEQKAKEAAAEARRQQDIALGRRLLNQAKATIGNDPATALQLGIAAQKIQPGSETRDELTGLVASTRQIGTVGNVMNVAYGPGNVIAVVESDYKASLWSVADRAKPVRLAFLDGISFLRQPVFSPDGKTLALVGGWNWEPVLFDVSNPAAPTLLGPVHAPDAGWLTFSPDGQTLAVVGLEGQWTLWGLADRANPTPLTKQTKGSESALTFSPDGHTAVTGGTVWDITDRTQPIEASQLDGTWLWATYSPTRPFLTTSDADGNLALWIMGNPREPHQLSTKSARARAASFSSDGLTLATSDNDGTARLWDMADNTFVPIADLDNHGGSAESLVFSPDGRTLATTALGTMSLWTVAAHGEPRALATIEDDPQLMMSAALTPDGQRLTTAHFDGTATEWDLSEPAHPVERATVRIHPGNIDGAAISPGGDTIAMQDWAINGAVTVTDIRDFGTPVTLGVLPAGRNNTPMRFSHDGRTLAVALDSAGAGWGMDLWNIADRQPPTRLAELPVTGPVTAIAFSPDGHTVAAATGKAVNLWNLADRTKPLKLGTLTGHSDTVLAVAFSPDGHTLATGSKDKTAALWNITDQTRGRRHAILTGNGAPVWSVAFAPDGHTLATGTQDDAAALWEVGEPSAPVRVATLKRTAVRSESILFHPNGHTLITWGGGLSPTRAVLWDSSTLNDLRANPAEVACAIADGGFTEDEWAAYIPEAPYQPTCSG